MRGSYKERDDVMLALVTGSLTSVHFVQKNHTKSEKCFQIVAVLQIFTGITISVPNTHNILWETCYYLQHMIDELFVQIQTATLENSQR